MTAKPKKSKLMTPTAYRDAIAQVGLTQVAASDFFEAARRTSPRWAQGQARIPGAVKKLLAVMISEGLSPEDVDKLVNQ
jgi:DNA-binding transcriptional regulator YiaG